ncbi:MAG: hypothetical protein AAGH48_03375 [Pseudomonadota bacterium]
MADAIGWESRFETGLGIGRASSWAFDLVALVSLILAAALTLFAALVMMPFILIASALCGGLRADPRRAKSAARGWTIAPAKPSNPSVGGAPVVTVRSPSLS